MNLGDYLYDSLVDGKTDSELISEFCQQLNEAKADIKAEKEEDLDFARQDFIDAFMNYLNTLAPGSCSSEDFKMLEKSFLDFEKEVLSFLNSSNIKDLEATIALKTAKLSTEKESKKDKADNKSQSKSNITDDDIISAFLNIFNI